MGMAWPQPAATPFARQPARPRHRPGSPAPANPATQTRPPKPGRPNNAAMRAALDFRLRRAGRYSWMKPGTNVASYWLPRGETVTSTQNGPQNAGINR